MCMLNANARCLIVPHTLTNIGRNDLEYGAFVLKATLKSFLNAAKSAC